MIWPRFATQYFFRGLTSFYLSSLMTLSRNRELTLAPIRWPPHCPTSLAPKPPVSLSQIQSAFFFSLPTALSRAFCLPAPFPPLPLAYSPSLSLACTVSGMLANASSVTSTGIMPLVGVLSPPPTLRYPRLQSPAPTRRPYPPFPLLASANRILLYLRWVGFDSPRPWPLRSDLTQTAQVVRLSRESAPAGNATGFRPTVVVWIKTFQRD